MATAENILKVKEILQADRERRFVVVSAPGKRFPGDKKITDCLYQSYDEAKKTGRCGQSFEEVKERFLALEKELGVNVEMQRLLEEIEETILRSLTPDYAASCGEFLCAKLLSAVMGYEFIDSRELVMFDYKGKLNAEYTNDVTKNRLSKVDGGAIIPGFYGVMPNGNIKTFTRGGSDITGAIVARATDASVYENWTDVNGFLIADPRIVPNPKHIRSLSYKELRELSYMGAEVLHPESIFPVKVAGIPVLIKNTFAPQVEGTAILPDIDEQEGVITGIAGKRGITGILVEKGLMNAEVGFTRKILSVLERYNISFEHLPSGVDTMSIVISDHELEGRTFQLVEDIKKAVSPDKIEVQSGLSLIATVGHGMCYKPGTAAKIFTALSKCGVNIRMIDQGSSELNIIVAVSEDDYEKAINAIYKEFIDDFR